MELLILECFAALFMFLSIIRPLVRGFWKLPGLTVCPLLALGIIIGIFPAYGFRPECIPLLLFAIFLFIAHLSDFLALFINLQSDAYRDKGLLFTFCSAAAFAFTLWVTFQYAPPINTDLGTKGIKTIFLQEDQLHIRIYGPTELVTEATELNEVTELNDIDETTEGIIDPQEMPQLLEQQATIPVLRPLLILLPPVAGSFTVTDEVCMALRDRGFTVLSYSRQHFDSPYFDRYGAPVRLNFPGLYRLGNALSRGLRNVKANAGGRKLEEIRKQDILFLLRELSESGSLVNLLGNVDKNTIFITGYGAGGAALTALAGQDHFIVSYPQVQGIITIEAPLLSSLEGDPLPDPLPDAANPINRLIQQVQEYFKSIKPRKITHISEIPEPSLPALYILSDHIINDRPSRYETILRTISNSKNSALIAAVRGAGPFDYSASPAYYPLLSTLFRGAEHTETHRNWPEVTASLITNFAVLLLENSAGGILAVPDDVTLPEIPLTKTALDSNTYLERGGVWQIPNVQTILQP